VVLKQKLIDEGFSLSNVNESDFDVYFAISRVCYEKYVDEYFGGWDNDFQLEMNTNAFNKHIKQSTFKKIFLFDEIVGFLAFNDLEDKIDGVIIQMTEKARNKGIGSFYLEHITAIAKSENKPIFLQVFKSNPAQGLYERYDFKTYEESSSHYLMRYDPST
jgi:ribosomal protein S18 acetylase RimI-like enzyme